MRGAASVTARPQINEGGWEAMVLPNAGAAEACGKC